MRKDIEQLGRELYHRSFPWGFVTNGLLLNEDRLESLLNSGLRSVTVSLDGLKESHNWLRGSSNSYDKALHAIGLLAKVKELNFDVTTVVNQRNFIELPRLKEVLIDLGVKNWRVFTIFPIGRAKENRELQLDPAEFKAVLEFIRQTRTENKIKVSNSCEGFLGNFEGETKDGFFMCRAGISVASVLADGSIAACPDLRENFIQGNIYKDNFADVWENKYEIFRDKTWTKTGICTNCELHKFCQGNGMHLRDEKTSELLFCHVKRIQELEKV
jgi:radical SAM enzyme (rSAM/lipoprotein system)